MFETVMFVSPLFKLGTLLPVGLLERNPMKPASAFTFFNTVVLPAVLLGTLLAPAPAQAPAVTDTATSAQAPPAVDPVSGTPLTHGHYTFAAAPLGSRAFVMLYDEADPTFEAPVIEVPASAGGLTKMQRAQKIAERMQKKSDTDPMFGQDLGVGNENGLVVVLVKNQSDSLVATADEQSKRTLGAKNCEVYAGRIIASIQERLKGIKLRDADFDCDLSSERKSARAAEYYLEAQADLKPGDSDTDAAVCKYKLAISYCDNPHSRNYYRLQLAELYSDLNQKNLARATYQQVQEAADAYPDDKKVAAQALQSLSAAKS